MKLLFTIFLVIALGQWISTITYRYIAYITSQQFATLISISVTDCVPILAQKFVSKQNKPSQPMFTDVWI